MQRGVSLSILALTAALAPGVAGSMRAAAQDAAGGSSASPPSGGDSRALDALGPGPGAQKASSHKAAPHRAAHHPRAVHASVPVTPAKPVAAVPSPTIPAAPPPPPVIKAPVINVPLHPEPPPPPVPVVATAAGMPSPIEGGARLTFGGGSADLNQANMQALQAFTLRLRADPQARAQIDAYGSGTADDPSTPRRMSLARGLAARAVLINGGVASTRIYVRAIGQPHDGGPADRIDLTRSEAVQPTPSSAPPAAPSAAASTVPASAPPAASQPPAPASAGDPTPDHAHAPPGKAATAP